MIVVYEADGPVEAHLMKNMLTQANIESYIHGESLTGGIGDLQAIGLVRVMVDEKDFDIAKEIINDWETAEIVSNENTIDAGVIPGAEPA